MPLLSGDGSPRGGGGGGFRPAVIPCWRRINAASSTITRALIPTFSISVPNRQIGTNTSLALRGRWFDDDRVNGTIFTRNEATLGEDISAVFIQKYRSASSVALTGFSSVNAARDVETPAQDPFNVTPMPQAAAPFGAWP